MLILLEMIEWCLVYLILSNNQNLLATLILLVITESQSRVVTRQHVEKKRDEMFINKLQSKKFAISNLPELINIPNA